MQVINQISQLKKLLDSGRQEGKSIGFVPTMGALHQGHLSLVKESVKNNPITVVSIFVNPSQFNDKSDLRNYPRDLKKDLQLLGKTSCDIIFAPSDSEMYPEKDTRTFEFGKMGSVMEGEHRPGHFNGVAQIVSKLFDAVEPNKAYFGQKDFQQLAIIRKMVSDYKYPIQIVGCPIVREKDGLAMSSRNELLTTEQRASSPTIYKTLLAVKELIQKETLSSINNFVLDTINSEAELQLEYFQIVDTSSLIPVSEIGPDKRLTACIAVHAGKVRLIDNVDLIS